MTPTNSPRIETQCPKAWVDMVGDSKQRYCEDCKLHVHNYSEMDEDSRRKLMSSNERVCIRYYLAPDGSFFPLEGLSPVRRAFINFRIGFAETLLSSLISFLTFLRRCRGIEEASTKPVSRRP